MKCVSLSCEEHYLNPLFCGGEMRCFKGWSAKAILAPIVKEVANLYQESFLHGWSESKRKKSKTRTLSFRDSITDLIPVFHQSKSFCITKTYFDIGGWIFFATISVVSKLNIFCLIYILPKEVLAKSCSERQQLSSGGQVLSLIRQILGAKITSSI